MDVRIFRALFCSLAYLISDAAVQQNSNPGGAAPSAPRNLSSHLMHRFEIPLRVESSTSTFLHMKTIPRNDTHRYQWIGTHKTNYHSVRADHSMRVPMSKRLMQEIATVMEALNHVPSIAINLCIG
jgi:hypothetical protein